VKLLALFNCEPSPAALKRGEKRLELLESMEKPTPEERDNRTLAAIAASAYLNRETVEKLDLGEAEAGAADAGEALTKAEAAVRKANLEADAAAERVSAIEKVSTRSPQLDEAIQAEADARKVQALAKRAEALAQGLKAQWDRQVKIVKDFQTKLASFKDAEPKKAAPAAEASKAAPEAEAPKAAPDAEAPKAAPATEAPKAAQAGEDAIETHAVQELLFSVFGNSWPEERARRVYEALAATCRSLGHLLPPAFQYNEELRAELGMKILHPTSFFEVGCQTRALSHFPSTFDEELEGLEKLSKGLKVLKELGLAVKLCEQLEDLVDRLRRIWQHSGTCWISATSLAQMHDALVSGAQGLDEACEILRAIASGGWLDTLRRFDPPECDEKTAQLHSIYDEIPKVAENEKFRQKLEARADGYAGERYAKAIQDMHASFGKSIARAKDSGCVFGLDLREYADILAPELRCEGTFDLEEAAESIFKGLCASVKPARETPEQARMRLAPILRRFGEVAERLSGACALPEKAAVVSPLPFIRESRERLYSHVFLNSGGNVANVLSEVCPEGSCGGRLFSDSACLERLADHGRTGIVSYFPPPQLVSESTRLQSGKMIADTTNQVTQQRLEWGLRPTFPVRDSEGRPFTIGSGASRTDMGHAESVIGTYHDMLTGEEGVVTQGTGSQQIRALSNGFLSAAKGKLYLPDRAKWLKASDLPMSLDETVEAGWGEEYGIAPEEFYGASKS
jgi:hypothetical protein